MTDAKTAAIKAAKAKTVAGAAPPTQLVGPDGKLTQIGLVLAVGGGLAMLLSVGVDDVFYVDGRGVTRNVRHTQWAWKKRSYAITEFDADEDRSVMDPTGEIDKIVGDRIYAEESARLDEEWRQKKMATKKPIDPEDAKHAAHPQPGVGGDGYTLCHMGFRPGCSAFAKKHEPITCEKCLEVIRMCRAVEAWRVV